MVGWKTLSSDKKIRLTILPHDGDIEAERRIRVLLELAIVIGKREGLLGNHLLDLPEVTAILPTKTLQTKEAEGHGH